MCPFERCAAAAGAPRAASSATIPPSMHACQSMPAMLEALSPLRTSAQRIADLPRPLCICRSLTGEFRDVRASSPSHLPSLVCDAYAPTATVNDRERK